MIKSNTVFFINFDGKKVVNLEHLPAWDNLESEGKIRVLMEASQLVSEKFHELMQDLMTIT